jgi:hypothetical protein
VKSRNGINKYGYCAHAGLAAEKGDYPVYLIDLAAVTAQSRTMKVFPPVFELRAINLPPGDQVLQPSVTFPLF